LKPQAVRLVADTACVHVGDVDARCFGGADGRPCAKAGKRHSIKTPAKAAATPDHRIAALCCGERSVYCMPRLER
jgi:hypothetical protein